MSTITQSLNLDPPLVFSKRKIQNGLLWLLVFSSFFVLIEPSPYEGIFALTFFVFLFTGFRLARPFAILIVCLALFNIGGMFSMLPFIADSTTVTYVITTFYMCLGAVFFAGAFLTDTYHRFEIVKQAWICAAALTSICGILGYFNVAGTAEIFTLYGRASGTFKDPNVFGPFLCGPALLIIEGFYSNRIKHLLPNLIVLLIILGGIFFSFSRGAWGVTIIAAIMAGVLIFITTPSNQIRLRIIVVICVGLALLMLILAAILSVESIRNLFFERFVLIQDYDGGSQGRFGKISSAIALLLDKPNGMGPLHFTDYFPEAPHNAYVNAFASYGWLGGLGYLGFVFSTFYMGWTALWKRTPWQSYYIAIWSFTFVQYLQGFQIDTDHWRHLWMVVGMSWGMGAASLKYERDRQYERDRVASINL